MAIFGNKIKNIPKHIWVLAAIILFGAFLRSYNFHAWLDFGSDQVNDATRVGAVVEGKAPWPSYGPDMGNSGTGGRSNRFRLGPMYYYFEIVSAKIFGNNPVSMAIPDLLFSILSIPLFYFFVRKIFPINSSLALTGLYSVSFYALSFSHSAWNVNPIPFFSLLFLISLHELIIAKEKTDWIWIILLGISLGVGIQLHAIQMVLFPIVCIFTFLVYLRKNPQVWKKIVVVLVIAVILNLGQIISEQKNGYLNTKIFFSSATGSSVNSDNGLFQNALDDLSCHVQANAFMLSAIGEDSCDFSVVAASTGDGNKRITKKILKPYFIAETVVAILFSIAGYALLFLRYRKEKDEIRKYFLGLILIYIILSFFVMLPVIDGALRYFNHTFFIPLIFLGLMMAGSLKRFSSKIATSATIGIFLLLVLLNIFSIKIAIADYAAKTKSGPDAIVLGEVEAMSDYLIRQSGNGSHAYLLSGNHYDNSIKSLIYLGEKKNFQFLRFEKENIPANQPVYYLWQVPEKSPEKNINGIEVENYARFGQIGVYKLKN